MESNVLDTLRDSMGSLRKTRVRPFCLEKTRMMMPERWKEMVLGVLVIGTEARMIVES